VQQVSDLHSKFALRPRHVYRSMVDIQSPTAEIRRKKEEEDRKKLQGKNIMVCPINRATIIIIIRLIERQNVEILLWR